MQPQFSLPNVYSDHMVFQRGMPISIVGTAPARAKIAVSFDGVKTLTLTVDELKEHESQLTDKCKELELKLKRVQSITQAGTQSDYNLRGEVRDSIVYVPLRGAYDTLRCSDYQDPYISFSYCVDSANIYTADITTRDTITAIAHRIPKKFLFFRYGTKEIKMEVLSSNPHTSLTTATHVVVEKR